MKLLKAKTMYKHWAEGKNITRKGIIYRVGRMSYGDYFLEPARPERTEREPFNKETIWIEKRKLSYK